MNDDEDTDVHMCLVCHSTITGILNYVNHKKNECSGRKGAKDSNLPRQTSFTTDSAVADFNTTSFTIGSSSSSFLGSSFNHGNGGGQQTFSLAASGQNPGFVDSVLNTQATITNTLDDFDPEHFPSGSSDNVGSLSEMFCTTIQQNMPVNQNLFDTSRTSHHGNGDILSNALSLSPVFSASHGNKPVDRNDDHGLLSACLNPRRAGHYRGEIANSMYNMAKSDKSPNIRNSININDIMPGSASKDSDLNTASEKVDHFFQSLELMSKNGPRVEKGSNQSLLPISTFLNNLTFSSDEEDLGFNFADDVSLDSLSDDSGKDIDAHQTGGKWKPGTQPSAKRSNRQMFRGKWPPGQAPAETKKKYYGSRATGGKNILALKQTLKSSRKPCPKSKKNTASRTCNFCQLSFENRFKYSKHCSSKEHKEKVFGQQEIAPVNFARGKGKSVKMYQDKHREEEEVNDESKGTTVETRAEDQEMSESVEIDEASKTKTNNESETMNKEKGEMHLDDDEQVGGTETDTYEEDPEKVTEAVEVTMDENIENEVEIKDGNGDDVTTNEADAEDGMYMDLPLFICTVCDKKYQNKYLLAQHLISKYHRNRASAMPLEAFQLLQQYQKYIVRFSPYQCTICRYYFNNHANLEDHLTTEVHQENCSDLMGEILCTLCSFKTHSQPEFLTHMCSKSHKAFVAKRKRICLVKECHVKCLCKYCGLQVRTYSRLKHHIQIKHKDGEIVEGATKRVIGQRIRPICKDCNKMFASVSAFELHRIRHHEPEKKLSCNLCNVRVAGKHALRMHEKTRKHLNQVLAAKFLKKEDKEAEKVKVKEDDKDVDEDYQVILATEEQDKVGKNEDKDESASKENGCHNQFVEHKANKESLKVNGEAVEDRSSNKDAADEDYVEEEEDDEDNDWPPPKKKKQSRRTRIGKVKVTDMVGKKKRRKRSELPKLSSNKIFKCDHCPFTVSVYNDLRPHYLQEHSGQIKMCEVCDLVFLSEKALKLHILSREHQDNISRSESNTATSQFFECHICKKKFTDEKYCKFHTAYKHFHVSTEEEVLAQCNGYDVTREKYKDILVEAEKLEIRGTIACPECGNLLKRNTFLEHLRIHTGDKPYKCKICPKEFASTVTLRRHLLGHFGCLACSCEICGKNFKKSSSYEEHMKVHLAEKAEKEKQHTCDTCGQSFYFEGQLQKHLRRHKTREFVCEAPGCHWKFVFRTELKAHMMTHDQNRPFLCDVCGYAAATKYRLRRHHRTHTGERKYHCEYCTYKAGNSTHLHRHMRIHIGSKPFKCPYCEYACNTHENIRKHILLTKKHKGMKIYPCKSCDFGTNNANDFRKHIVETHGDVIGENYHLDALSVFTGLYDRGLDPKKPEEGARIISVKERNIGGSTRKEGGGRSEKKRKVKANSNYRPINFVDKEHSYKVMQLDKNLVRETAESLQTMTKSPKSVAAMTLMNLASTVPGTNSDMETIQELPANDDDQNVKVDNQLLTLLKQTPSERLIPKATVPSHQIKEPSPYQHLGVHDLNPNRNITSGGLTYTHLTAPMDSLLKPSLFTPGSHFPGGIYAGYKNPGVADSRDARNSRYNELEEHHGAGYLGQHPDRMSAGQAQILYSTYGDQAEGDARDGLVFNMQTTR